MRKYCWVIFLFSFQYTYAQINIANKIVDQNNTALVNVLVQDPDGVCKTHSDEAGNFKFYCKKNIRSVQFINNGELLKEYSLEELDGLKNSEIKLTINTVHSDNQGIPLINLPNASDDENEQQNISSLLSASRDVFSSIAGFSFSSAGFEPRGYPSEFQTVYINNMPVNDPESGNSFFGTWGGLNDVMRTDQFITGLNPNAYGFGNIGGSVIINATAATQRKQKKVSYSLTNRSYQHRVMGTYSTGLMSNGWAFSVSGSHRWANEGYVPGTFYDAWGYYLGAEKHFKDGSQLALTVIGAPTRRGKAAPSVQEMNDLAGTNFYNPNWGYQNGEKRNAKVNNTHLPTAYLNYMVNLKPNLKWNNALSFQTGREGNSSLDWFDAPDPRPDYYRRLPSYSSSPDAAQQITDLLKSSEAERQVNWQELYNVNAASNGTVTNANGINGNNVTGKISKYLVNEKRTDNTVLNLNTYLTAQLKENISLTGGIFASNFKSENFQTVLDLLGGDFIVDYDKYAVRDFPNDTTVFQNDLNNPNRIVKEGEKYGYDFNNYIRSIQPWAQLKMQLNKVDLFVAGQYGYTSMWREGLVKNGRFPDDSYGEATKQNFNTYNAKAGLTYKINNRNYAYFNTAYISQAPLIKDIYLSPRTRDDVAPNLKTEKILSGEIGYIFQAPNFKTRITAYYTQFRDMIKTTSYYHDDLRTFVNFTLNGIGSTHTGIEIGSEYKISSSFTLQAAVNLGDYYYDTRPLADISQDNVNKLIAQNKVIYQKDFFVPNTPQTAIGLNLKYNGPKRWYATLNVSYFDKMYIDFNPDRRTNATVAGLDDASDLYRSIIQQERLKAAYTTNLFVGKSWNLDRKHYLSCNLSVNNILNNTSFKTGGFEQLRFDYTDNNVNKFPPKYFYLYGLSYGLNISLSF